MPKGRTDQPGPPREVRVPHSGAPLTAEPTAEPPGGPPAEPPGGPPANPGQPDQPDQPTPAPAEAPHVTARVVGEPEPNSMATVVISGLPDELPELTFAPEDGSGVPTNADGHVPEDSLRSLVANVSAMAARNEDRGDLLRRFGPDRETRPS